MDNQDPRCDMSWQQKEQKPGFCFGGGFLCRCMGPEELERYLESLLQRGRDVQQGASWERVSSPDRSV